MPVNTLVELLRERARLEPARGLTFLRDGEEDEARISYRELDAQARAIASRIQQEASPGDRALLLFAPGLDYIAAFFGCLYAGLIPVPVYPPEPHRLERSLLRLQAVAE